MKKALSVSILLFVLVLFLSPQAIAQNKVVVIPLSDSSGGSSYTATVFFQGRNNSSASTYLNPRYAGMGGATDASDPGARTYPMTRDCTIKNFRLNIYTNGLTQGDCKIALEKNGSDTAITATYNSSTATGSYTISGTVDYSADDTFAVYAQGIGTVEGDELYFTGAFDIENQN
jgi:hypothetical protein